MSMKDLVQAFAMVEAHPEQADFDGPKSEDVLNWAEQKLGLAFPPTYRAFLSRLGCGHIAGAEFYGVIKKDVANSSVPDAIWLTLQERQAANAPRSLVIVGSTGDGGYYAIDCSTPWGESEKSIVEWWPGFQQQKDVAEDFGEFFLRSILEALAE